MSALPADDNYRPSPMPRVPFRREADVVSLVPPRPEGQPTPPLPEPDRDETPQNDQPTSSPNSGTRITLSDLPGDWESVTALWTGSPEPLRDLVDQAARARKDEDAQAIAMACWAVLVLIPRGLLHLASWVLAHPLRSLAAAAVAAIFVATL
ncbi:hypothetical protein ACN26Z_00275 [Verrucosispora sp. WMMD703]|uniref:hypothetical protein n=1 Tax=Verrucosispora sp. WMMD703 TaxID=3403463 RepID=UPI003B933B08